MADDHGPNIKNDEVYEKLKNEGYGKAKAAKISNAVASDEIDAAEEGGRASPYEDWSKEELYDRAQELGVDGRSDMTKNELIAALRDT